MRGLVLLIVFFSALPFIFVKGPFFGILLWYWISLMNPQKLVWNSVAGGIPYAEIVAVLPPSGFGVSPPQNGSSGWGQSNPIKRTRLRSPGCICGI
jgi:hypothetical protein